MSEQEERWKSEQAFFDAEEYSQEALSPETVDRYVHCRHPFTPAEYPFAMLGDVRGKKVFEFGCGDGSNSLILALKGARVVALDISQRAIESARIRAKKQGVADRIEFHAMPVEKYLEQSDEVFDIVCGFQILHHLLPVLDSVLANLRKLGDSKTTYVFTEPVVLASWFRKLRLMLPLSVYATPDERPLEEAELAVMRKHFPDLEMHLKYLTVRVWKRFIGGRYEDFSPFKRGLFHTLCRTDDVLLSMPGIRVLGASAFFRGHPASAGVPSARARAAAVGGRERDSSS